MLKHCFKFGGKALLTNYRPIFFLPCFSKILKRIIYNRLCKYLTRINLLFNKQFGFREGHSIEYSLTEQVHRTCDSVNENKYTLGIFINLSKAFDIV